MKIGISTYSFFWKFSDQVKTPITLIEMLRKSKELGAGVFQICDYSPIEEMSEDELDEIKSVARNINMELELGTRGVHPSHLQKYVRIAKRLNVSMIRSMKNDRFQSPTIEQAAESIREMVPELEKNKISFALETYEQLKTEDLVRLVKMVDSPFVGICLDPGNCIAALETPEQVINATKPYVLNMHAKDFVFTRKEGWVGFSLIGCPLGEGQLDFDFMMNSIIQEGKNPNIILELWAPFTETIEKTVELESQWLEKSIQYLRRKLTCQTVN